MNAEALIAGHLCLDIFPGMESCGKHSPSDVFSPGKLTEINEVCLSLGGAVPNTGINMQQLGIPVALCGKTGMDPLGQFLLELINNHHLPVNGIKIDPAVFTSYSIMIEMNGMDKIALHYPGANHRFNCSDIDEKLWKDIRLFHFGYPPLMKSIYQNDGEELVKIFKRAKEAGITTSLDMAPLDPHCEAGRINWRKYLQHVLPWVDIFVPSLEEIFCMLYPGDYIKIIRENPCTDLMDILDLNILPVMGEMLIHLGSKMVLIKCGKHGLYLKTAQESLLKETGLGKPLDTEAWSHLELFQPSFSIPEVLSATGSGDACIAGFLASILRNKTPLESLENACACGAIITGKKGNTGCRMPLNDLRTLIDKPWKKNPVPSLLYPFTT